MKEMSDLISRQNAIDAALTFLVEYCGAAFDIDMQKMLCERLDALPSAEPERKWIPFDVVLPNDRQKVLCVNKHGEMMIGGYMTDYGMTFPCYFEKPIAWMPLPEPYRGE